MATLLIVDDDEDIRRLIRHEVSSSHLDLAVVGEASGGHEGVERWRELHPDVVIIDERMPGYSGMDAAVEILAENPEQAIVLFTAYLDSALREVAEAAGIRCCLTKAELHSLSEELAAILGL
jgi:YesN/AraC family two-component response regulator